MNTMKTFLLMGLLTVLLIFIGGFLGGQNGMFVAFAFALVMNFGSYWFSDKRSEEHTSELQSQR